MGQIVELILNLEDPQWSSPKIVDFVDHLVSHARLLAEEYNGRSSGQIRTEGDDYTPEQWLEVNLEIFRRRLKKEPRIKNDVLWVEQRRSNTPKLIVIQQTAKGVKHVRKA